MESTEKVRYLEPRTMNRSSRVELFIKLWDTPLSPEAQTKLREQAPVTQKASTFGNLNNDGTPFPSESCLLGRFHPDFESVIEPGVKEFLFAIAIEHDMVTYTSCQGHFYEGDERPHDERHVGVIPRDDDEYRRTLDVFERVARDVNRQIADRAIEVAIMDHTVADGETIYKAVDLYLSRREDHTWPDYFAEVDDVCAVLVDSLLAHAPNPAG